MLFGSAVLSNKYSAVKVVRSFIIEGYITIGSGD